LSTFPSDVLVVDENTVMRGALRRMLTQAGFAVESSDSSRAALALLRARRFDAVVSDLPPRETFEFVRSVRRGEPQLPVVMLMDAPSTPDSVGSARCGGLFVLRKPGGIRQLVGTVAEACAAHRLTRLERSAFELSGDLDRELGEACRHFDASFGSVHMLFQPIVDYEGRSLFGHEALVRVTRGPTTDPVLLFDAAERLGRVRELGQRIRSIVAEVLTRSPGESLMFVNLHPLELGDDDLLRASAPLAKHAHRVVLEVTERRSLERISNLSGRLGRLRQLGFRIAVDDLGSGYAGLASLSHLAPDVTKLDMSLVRGIDRSPRNERIVSALISLCDGELGIPVVCEGVETAAERDTLQRIGGRLLQGYLFGRPDSEFPSRFLL
jgi:EAL domain-containing protein (putative c-di-GMP-specific phosphodiesterase class I)